MNHLMNTNSAGARLSLVVALLTALVACAGPTSPSRDESPTHPTARVAVSGRLTSGGFATQSTDEGSAIERADTVVAIPVSTHGMWASSIAQARTDTIQPDGSFSIEIPTGQGSWIVLAVDSTATGFDKVVGHMVVDEGTARLHTLPIENADGDVEFGTLSFDAASAEFVAEYRMSAYADTMNLSVEELRAIALTDSMSKLAINLYVNYTPTDYWNMMTAWPFRGALDDAVGAYAPAHRTVPHSVLIYTRFHWDTPDITIHDVISGSAVVEVFPPAEVVDYIIDPAGTTYGPDKPYTNVGYVAERTQAPEGEYAPGALHYFSGGLIVVVGRDGAIGFDARSADTSTNTLVPGVWRVHINNQDRAWFDVRIGSPFDANGNLIALIPEPRLTFNSDGILERFDVRFAQMEGPDAFAQVEMTSALNQLTWGGMTIHDETLLHVNRTDNGLQTGFSMDANHPAFTYSWYLNAENVPEDGVALHVIGIATRTYGEDFAFWFDRQ